MNKEELIRKEKKSLWGLISRDVVVVVVGLFMLLLMSASASAVDTTDLVSYWKLDETSGSVLDAHGSNDGTNIGATPDVAGKINTAYEFSTSANGISVPDSADLRLTGDEWSVGLWTNFDTVPTVGSSTHYRLIVKDDGNDNSGGYSINLWSGTIQISRNGGTAGTSMFWNTGFVPNASQWYHFVVTWEKGVGTKFYVDGTLYGSTTLAVNNNIVGEADDPLKFGYIPVYNQRLDGKIDEVAIFDVTLASTEVNDLYNSGSGLAYPFTTANNPTISSSAASNVMSVGAVLNGDLTSLGDETSVNVYFEYRLKDSVGAWTSTTPVSKSATGTFNQAISSLAYNTEYEFRSVVSWNAGADTATGTTLYFTTVNPVVGVAEIYSGNTYNNEYYNGVISARASVTNFDSVECQYSINGGSSYISTGIYSSGNYCIVEDLNPQATINLKFRARSGSSGAWVVTDTKTYTYDATSPVSLALSPTSRAWGNTNVGITLSATDAVSGVDASTYLYCATSTGSSCTPSVSSSSLTLSSEGEWTVCFNVADNLGNIANNVCSSEGAYKIDKTNPTTSGAVTSGSTFEGVYYTDVVYTLTPSDALSGVASTAYCVDSVNTCTPSTSYTGAVSLTTSGNHYIRFRSTDNAGNVQTTQSSGLIEINKELALFFRVTLIDAYTRSSISDFCVEFAGRSDLDDCTTTGLITTNISYSVAEYDLSFYNIGGVDNTHFDFNVTTATDEDYQGEAVQAYLDINLFEAVTGDVLSDGFNFTIDGGSVISSDSLPMPIVASEYDLLIMKSGYENNSYLISVDALTTYTLDAVVGDVFLYLTAQQLGNNATINTFNGWVYNEDYDYNVTFTTTTGSVFVPLIKNLTYSLQGVIPDFANLDLVNVSINDTQYNYTFTGFRINAIDIVFYNEFNKQKINNTEIRLELIGDYASYNYTTTTGELALSLLEPSSYIMRYYATGFDDGFYLFTVLNRSYSTLDLYMINSTDSSQITVTIIDESANNVEGAVVKLLKYDILTNSYLITEIRTSDVAGETIFNVRKNQEFYKFIVELDDVVVRSTNPAYITSDLLNIQIFSQGIFSSELFSFIGITGTVTYNNDTKNFRAEYNDPSNIGSIYCLEVFEMGRAKTLLNETCSSSPAGVLLVNYVVEQGKIYEANLYVKINPTQKITGFVLDLSEVFAAGSMGLIIQILLTLFFAFTFLYSPSLGLVMTPLSLIIGRILQLNSLDWYVITPLIIIGGIVAFLLEQRR